MKNKENKHVFWPSDCDKSVEDYGQWDLAFNLEGINAVSLLIFS